MNASDHYKNHLAHIYAWMAGDFQENSAAFVQLLDSLNVSPDSNKAALDLGAGHGIQSHALATKGFDVTAVDFNQKMLNDLQENCKDLEVRTVFADITKVDKWTQEKPGVIVCCGDTLTHLKSREDVEEFLIKYATLLDNGGKMVLTFRDYSQDHNDTLYIPVKSDDSRILTCVLEYGSERVKVTDLLHEKIGGEWQQKVSSYEKVRVSPDWVKEILQGQGLTAIHEENENALVTLVASKG